MSALPSPTTPSDLPRSPRVLLRATRRLSTCTGAITFEDGLYSLQDIRDEISSYCLSANLHDAALDVIGHAPTQKGEFRWDVQGTGYGVVLYLSDATSIGKLLGVDATDVFYDTFRDNAPLEVARFRVGASANFDALGHYLMHVSCLSGTNYDSAGSASSQVACAITPDVAPGNMIRYRPPAHHPHAV